ncbi:MAG: alpha/beta hydrolase [Caldilineaceae bacterium]
MPTLTIADQTIYYTHSKPPVAQRPPLVLVHGAGGDHLHWPPQLRRLAGCEVYALDLPGHGRSPGAGRDTIAAYVQVLSAFVDTLALPPFVLAGHSMGGAIALAFALDYTDLLAGLVLIGTGARLRVSPTLLAGLQTDFDATTAQVIDWMYTSAFPYRPQALQQLRTNDPQTLHDDFLACDHFDVRVQVASLTLPTLIICGVADTMTPIKVSETLHQAIGGSQLHRVAAAGHMVMIEQPAAVTGLVDEFLTIDD